MRRMILIRQTYGHLNGYRYQVNVTSIKDVAVLFKGMLVKRKQRRNDGLVVAVVHVSYLQPYSLFLSLSQPV